MEHNKCKPSTTTWVRFRVADYHRSASAYLNKQWDEAQKAWGNLLKRPEQDRHYRTVWAAFMLGELGRTIFNLLRNGFSGFDRKGRICRLVRPGRGKLRLGRPQRMEAGAPGKNGSIIAGATCWHRDSSAVVSLKALIPDREPIEGMLNYGPESDEQKQLERSAKARTRTEGDFEIKICGAGSVAAQIGDGAYPGDSHFGDGTPKTQKSQP